MFCITHYDHVGVRVTNREQAIAFYRKLGFEIEPEEDSPQFNAVGLINAEGVRINLIYNGETPPENRNVLMDISEKYPGYTHYAVIVDSLQKVLDWAAQEGIPITEGPLVIGGRRTVCFIRDPDGNVVEFDELLPA
ncbi:VOC family protein [Leptolyngbya sp. NK1-12]|uniref:VOC family protein n=1 Tax=Leptolyngbya sp. NK1-12 TaxID=2547451 RepID=A0AA96WFI8_9CYAN|nr:VOC family protein [Leptolyngbya sp. NK1-12]WNZ24145.1 VOC family protein [Leptolyngbya sp. NK1-12]